ncbi:glycosyltransferase family 87 protein [Cupriavidus necator]|uniref:glycosyltransferase family 87 protein n=1 Tax=Cupriavidus necator TaxID=106590 RepID=UPI001E445C53|nr:glycosyltransferase family 87 protein [Cupriavidus necator]
MARGIAVEAGRDSVWKRLHKPDSSASPWAVVLLVHRWAPDQNGASTSMHRRCIAKKNTGRCCHRISGGWGAMSLDHSPAATPGSVMSRHWLDLERLRAYSVAMLIVYGALIVIWAFRTHGFTTDAMGRPGVDFSAFWSASYLAIKGQAAAVYDYHKLAPVIAAFGAVEREGQFFLPWVYPPTFLLFVMPLSLLPFAASYLLFIGGTAVMYIAAVLRILSLPGVPRHVVWLPVLAFPGIHEAAMIGQNSLLTAGVAAWALIQLKTRPVLSGLLIGLLCIKPQLALMLPLALVADRAWKTFFTAAATAAAMAACSIALWGWQIVPTFLDIGTHFRQTVLEQGEFGWRYCPTLFAMMRRAGAPVAIAYLAHGLGAGFAIWALIKVWRGRNSTALRIAAVAAATLLVSPYVWYYELTWMGLAIAGLAVEGVTRGWREWEREILVVAWLLPIVLSANHAGHFPQVGPLVTLLLLMAILRRARTGERFAPGK